VSFDRIAPHYRWLETAVFGGALQRSRTCWIDTLSAPKSALIIGEGNGRFLCALVKAHPGANVDCVDSSPRMLERARNRLIRSSPGSAENVRFLLQDVRFWVPPQSYDLVVTHFVLDCFSRREVERIVDALARAAAPGADWLLSDFTIPERGWSRQAARALIAGMYSFFRATTGIEAKALVEPAPRMGKHGFFRASSRAFYAGMVRADLWRRKAPREMV
jgi:ubiquinone/menaquinone biosynthesis C-methylase UbiE